MRKFFKYFFLTLTLTFHIFLAASVNYIFPKYDVTKVTGVEVKRVDKDGPITKSNPADGPTRDVYFVYTQDEKGKLLVFRNEDTRWSFPFYFKFGAAELQGKLQGFANEQKNVEIKYYGWRIAMFEEYPNIINANELPEDGKASHSILAYIFYAFLLITLFFSVQFIRGWFDSE